MLTDRIPPYTVNRHRVNSELIVSRIFFTDGVYCRREPVGTGPVVVKVVRVTGPALSGFTMNHFIICLSFPTPTAVMVCSGHHMCNTESKGVYSTCKKVRNILPLELQENQYEQQEIIR